MRKNRNSLRITARETKHELPVATATAASATPATACNQELLKRMQPAENPTRAGFKLSIQSPSDQQK